MSHRTANVARTPSRKWELDSNWLTAGKECGSILSSRLWGGALRDDTKNCFVADYGNIGCISVEALHRRLRVLDFCLPTFWSLQDNIFKDYFFAALVDFRLPFSINFLSSSAFLGFRKDPEQHDTPCPLRLVSFVDWKIYKHI